MQKLYKRDNTGATRIWWAEIKGSAYRLYSGQLDGAITVTNWTRCEERNSGRSNQTTAEEQCEKEVEALYAKKIKRGYTETLAEIDQSKDKLISPMLAHKWQDHSDRIIFPVYTQPKLDGIRCIAKADGLWTRKGEPIKTVPHIEQFMSMLAIRLQVSFDGELYNHDFHDDFNKIQSLITKKKQSPEGLRDVKRLVQYHVYDLVDNTKRFGERIDALKRIFLREMSEDNESIVLVNTKRIDNMEGLDERYEWYLHRGYEGQMIRADEPYERKRSKHLLKRKEFQDDEFEIINMVEGKGNRSGMVGALVFNTANGAQFQAALTGTDAYRRQVWEDKESYIGVPATVKYQNLTPDGIPRFPVVKSIDEGK